MIKLFLNKIDPHTFFLGLIALFPLYKLNFNSYTILLFVLNGLIYSLKSKSSREEFVKRLKNKKKIFFLSTLIIYAFTVSLIYSENNYYGLRSIQHLIPLFVFPFAFFFLNRTVSEKELKLIFNIFLIACFLQLIYIHFNFYDQGLYRNIKQAKFYDLPFRVAIMNFSYESLHPTYISLWYCFAIAILLNSIKRIDSYKAIFIMIFKIAFIITLLTTIILLSSRIGMLGVSVVIGYYIFKFKNLKIKNSFLLLFLIAIVYSLNSISFVSSRFITEFEQTKLTEPIGKNHNSINIRIGIYQCSFLIIKENYIFGVGIGDVQDELNRCYLNFDTDVYKKQNYNSHNYFLHSLLSAGLLGLLSLLIMFFVFLKIAIKSDNYMYMCFLIIILIALTFENLLSRNHGIIFFVFFNTLFVEYLQDKKNGNSIHRFI